MSGNGYIRDELDVKFLILFVLAEINMPVSLDDVFGTVFVDDAMDYFSTSSAFYDLVNSGHINDTPEGYLISVKGRDAVETYSDRLPPSVKRKAQQSALQTTVRIKRENSLSCVIEEKDERNIVVKMRISDGKNELMNLEMLVVNRDQAHVLETNFKSNADKIYNAVLNDLLKDYKKN